MTFSYPFGFLGSLLDQVWTCTKELALRKFLLSILKRLTTPDLTRRVFLPRQELFEPPVTLRMRWQFFTPQIPYDISKKQSPDTPSPKENNNTKRKNSGRTVSLSLNKIYIMTNDTHSRSDIMFSPISGSLRTSSQALIGRSTVNIN